MNDNKWCDPNRDETSGVCQMNMVFLNGALNITCYSISTRSTRDMIYDAGLDSGDESETTAKQKAFRGGRGGVIAAYLTTEELGRNKVSGSGVQGAHGGRGGDIDVELESRMPGKNAVVS
ncbi:hypothetical protein QBC45DRAFT_418270 [Copromyces sp. CBS 386.78]|nr:hypothetical protein QBC45DRAFT_418270 [Copromyces sp. CBS 386.78]